MPAIFMVSPATDNLKTFSAAERDFVAFWSRNLDTMGFCTYICLYIQGKRYQKFYDRYQKWYQKIFPDDSK